MYDVFSSCLGLGKQLRLLGVDVHIIDDDRGDDHDDAAKFAHTENRIILTAGKVCNTLASSDKMACGSAQLLRNDTLSQICLLLNTLGWQVVLTNYSLSHIFTGFRNLKLF